MWIIVDSTKGFFLEYWVYPPGKAVVSLEAPCDLPMLEALMHLLRAAKVEPR